MQYFKLEKITGLFVGLVMLIAGSSAAMAAGTASSTLIDNTATVNYDVGGIGQTLIESSPTGNSTPGVGSGTSTDFVVDNRVDLLVSSTANNTVTPNDTTLVAITFTVTNEGNTTQNYLLSAVQDAGDNFDMQNVAIYIDNPAGADPGNFDGADPLYSGAAGSGDVAADASITVFIVGNTDAINPTNGQVSNITLQAQTATAGGVVVTAETGDGVAWAPATVQVVYGDDAGAIDAIEDGLHSATGTFTVATSSLTVTKTQVVTSDPFSATNPKAIPGAVITYTLTVANAVGGSAAESVVITDVIPAGVTYNANSVQVDFGGGAVGYTDGAGDGVAAIAGATLTVDISAAATAQVIAGAPDLNAGTTATVTFTVTVNTL